MKRHRITADEAALIHSVIGQSWSELEVTSDEEQKLLDLRYLNVLHQRSETVQLRAWAANQIRGNKP